MLWLPPRSVARG